MFDMLSAVACSSPKRRERETLIVGRRRARQSMRVAARDCSRWGPSRTFLSTTDRFARVYLQSWLASASFVMDALA
jgi:hypothetical protein